MVLFLRDWAASNFPQSRRSQQSSAIPLHGVVGRLVVEEQAVERPLFPSLDLDQTWLG
jgi:hypothetical protein